MNKWELGPKYSFAIHYSEFEVVRLQHENQQLKREKRVLEQSLEEETNKRMRVEENLNNVTNTVKENKKAYKKRFKQLVNKVPRQKENV